MGFFSSITDTLFGSKPKVQQMSPASMYLPEVSQAITKLMGLESQIPASGAEAAGGYEKALQNLISSVSAGAEPAISELGATAFAAPAAMYGGIPSQLWSAIQGVVPQIGGTYDTSIANIQEMFEGLKPFATSEAQRAFDVVAQRGGGARSGAAKEIGEEAYMRALYQPMYSAMTGLEQQKAQTQAGSYQGYPASLQNILSSLAGEQAKEFQSAYLTPMTQLAQLPAGIVGAVSSYLDPMWRYSQLANLYSTIAQQGSGLRGETVVQPGTQGMVSSALSAFAGGAGQNYFGPKK